MKLLWTISNWKHTGPVQPSLDLAAGVAALGHDVRVAVGVPPARYEPEAEVLREERHLARANAGARLAKHAFVLRDLPDALRLARWIRRERPEGLVATLANDHRTLLSARRRANGPPVSRLWFSDGEGAVPAREATSLRASARVAAFGDLPVRRLLELGIPASRILRLDPPLDVRGLSTRAGPRPAARAALGIPSDLFLFGIVARMQRHRRFEMLWEAAASLARTGLAFRLLVLGRGTFQEEVGFAPVRRLGLEGHVVFAGYRLGREYARTVAALDAQILLVPGSDPTCRALREGMALSVPSLAVRRGLLPSIVEDGRTGLLVPEDGEALAAAMRRMAADPAATRAMGEAAARRARESFAAEKVAADLVEALSSPVS